MDLANGQRLTIIRGFPLGRLKRLIDCNVSRTVSNSGEDAIVFRSSAIELTRPVRLTLAILRSTGPEFQRTARAPGPAADPAD